MFFIRPFHQRKRRFLADAPSAEGFTNFVTELYSICCYIPQILGTRLGVETDPTTHSLCLFNDYCPQQPGLYLWTSLELS